MLGRLMQKKVSVMPGDLFRGSSFSLALEFAAAPASFLDPMSWFASSATTTSTLAASAGCLEFVKDAFDVEGLTSGAQAPTSLLQVDSAESLRAWACVKGRRFASALLSCKKMTSKSTSSSLLEKASWASTNPGLQFLLKNPGKVSEVGFVFGGRERERKRGGREREGGRRERESIATNGTAPKETCATYAQSITSLYQKLWSRTLHAAFFQPKEPLLEKLYALVHSSVLAISSLTISSELATTCVKLDNIPISSLLPFSAEELKVVGAKDAMDDKERALVVSGLAALPGLVYAES